MLKAIAEGQGVNIDDLICRFRSTRKATQNREAETQTDSSQIIENIDLNTNLTFLLRIDYR